MTIPHHKKQGKANSQAAAKQKAHPSQASPLLSSQTLFTSLPVFYTKPTQRWEGPISGAFEQKNPNICDLVVGEGVVKGKTKYSPDAPAAQHSLAPEFTLAELQLAAQYLVFNSSK